jgi:hypothetical protein
VISSGLTNLVFEFQPTAITPPSDLTTEQSVQCAFGEFVNSDLSLVEDHDELLRPQTNLRHSVATQP